MHFQGPVYSDAYVSTQMHLTSDHASTGWQASKQISLGNPSKREARQSPHSWGGGDEKDSCRVALLVPDGRVKMNIVSIWAHITRSQLKEFRFYSDMEAGIEKSMSVKWNNKSVAGESSGARAFEDM